MQYFAYAKVYILNFSHITWAHMLYGKLKLKVYFNAKTTLEQIIFVLVLVEFCIVYEFTILCEGR